VIVCHTHLIEVSAYTVRSTICAMPWSNCVLPRGLRAAAIAAAGAAPDTDAAVTSPHLLYCMPPLSPPPSLPPPSPPPYTP
jgi:hypothetical protein